MARILYAFTVFLIVIIHEGSTSKSGTKSTKCKVHEVKGCGNTCLDLCPSIMQVCPFICLADGCKCETAYYRLTQTGPCVPESRCPSATISTTTTTTTTSTIIITTGAPAAECDVNEVSGCGNPCFDLCPSIIQACPQYCRANGCQCKPGYNRLDQSSSCVPQSSCPAAAPASSTS